MLTLLKQGFIKMHQDVTFKSPEITDDVLDIIRKNEMNAAYRLTNYVLDRYCQMTDMIPLYQPNEVKKEAKSKKMRLIKQDNNVYSVLFHILRNGKWVLNLKKDDTIIDVLKELKYLRLLAEKFCHPKGVGFELFWSEITEGDPRLNLI
jgi:hypothetical protein